MDMERYGRVYINNGLQPNPFMENHTATTWLKRTDARISTLTDKTVHLTGRHANETFLRSKQELLRQEDFGWA